MSIELDPITSGYQLSKINTNFQKLEDELNSNVLRRDGVSPGEDNSMKNNLDMNSHAILNAKTDINDDGSLVTVEEFNRAVRVPHGETIPDAGSVEDRKGKVLAWDVADGHQINVSPISTPSDLAVALASSTGTSLIGSGLTTLDKILTVDVKQFGAHPITEPGYETFDSQPAFQAAIDFVKSKGGGVVTFTGTYSIINAPFTYVLPYDDGSYSPLFTSGERTLTPETPSTMKAHLELPSGVRIRGETQGTSVLNFGWDHNTGPIGLTGTIGIVARVEGYPTNGRMTHYVCNVELDRLMLRNVFIGFVSDGIMFDRSRMGDVTYAWCGIPMIAQGVDSSLWGYQELIGNYAGIVIGGMWLHRNNTQSGGRWVPPYVNGTDIYSLGWCDYLTLSNLTMSGKQWSQRHIDVDTFFDQEFYKSRNDVTEANGGRLTNQHAIDFRPSDYSKDPYRGIAGRAFALFARYKRGNSIGMLASRVKIMYSPRVPFLTPSPNSGYSGVDWYGYIDYGFAERVGIRDMNGGSGASNRFYETGSDPINTDQTILPATIVEGSIQCKTHALAGTPSAPPSTIALRENYRSTNVYYTRDSNAFRNAPKTGDNMMRYGFVYSPEANTGTIYERLWIGRHETQPHCYFFDDKNELHQWRTRTTGNATGQFRLRSGYNGAVVFPDAVTRSLVYQGGIVKCYFKFNVTPEMVALGNTELWISGFPNNSAGTHDFGNDLPYINIIRGRINNRNLAVTGGGGGTVSVPVPIGSCRVELGQLCMYLDQGQQNPLRYGDLVAGREFSACVVYNTPWGLYNTDEGLNGKQT